MTIQIGSSSVLIIVLGCIVAVAVFKYTASTHYGPVSRGDLVGAIGSGVAVATLLALLLNASPEQTPLPVSRPDVAPTAPAR
ncbi:hypothetical protein [Streptomyces xantholiticus]|uniref:Uncharacterized protein n=1 Tax=Streptomyces xantholiticus TaxID=68285 RepID=A0ABV1V0R8_9ACTN